MFPGSRHHSIRQEIEENMKLPLNTVYKIFMKKKISNVSLFPHDLSPTIGDNKVPFIESPD